MWHRQPQYQVLHKSQVRMSLLNYLVLLLLMIFSLHLFIHFIVGLTLGFQECIRITIYFRLKSGDVGEDDDLRAEGHTFTRKESHWVQMGLHCQVKSRWLSGSFKCENSSQMILIGID